MNHHPSCRPNDTGLLRVCEQCGERESASDIENALDEKNAQISMLVEAGRWVENVYNNVSKDGGPPDMDESMDAHADLLFALKSAEPAARAHDAWVRAKAFREAAGVIAKGKNSTDERGAVVYGVELLNAVAAAEERAAKEQA